jgi:hypothetical protein
VQPAQHDRFDELNRGDAFHRGRLSDERVATLTAMKAAITYLVELREGRVR